MNMTLWKLDSIGERLWALATTTATVAAVLGNKGRGMAIVAEETRNLANRIKAVVEQSMEDDQEINSEKIMVCAELLNYLALNTAIEAARLYIDGKQAAVCAEEIRNLSYALRCLFDKDLPKKYQHGVTPWAAKPMTTITSQSEFLLLDIGDIPIVEPLKNIVEILVTGYTEMERQQGNIHARNRVIPLADGYKLLGNAQDAKAYVIIDTPWAEQNNRYAVAAQVSCIFVSPIGNPISVPSDMALASYVRECWENENGEPFYFMDWAKMV